MAQLGSAGSELKLPIGQVPRSVAPELGRELQAIYNALHITNEYMTALRRDIEGSDAQDPSQSLKFRRTFNGIAGRELKLGDMVCAVGDRIYPGIGTNNWSGRVNIPPTYVRLNNSLTGLRSDSPADNYGYMVAMADAAPGAPVKVGVGPGVLSIPGIKCGAIIWAKAARGIIARGGTNNNDPVYFNVNSRPLVGDGSIYLNSNRRNVSVGDLSIPSEGTTLPGYPQSSGSTITIGIIHFYPVGICIKDNYLFLYDHIEG